MVTNCKLNVGVSFDDGWAEIFIAVNNEKVGLATKVFQGKSMMLGDIRQNTTRLEKALEANLELE